PIEIDPRPCELCGCTIDRHEMVDDGAAPIFYCPDVSPDEMTLEELERRAELIRRIEVAEIMARMEATAGPFKVPAPAEPRRYSTPQSTIDAFLFVARNHDADYVARWLENHPRDVATLTELWREKNGLS